MFYFFLAKELGKSVEELLNNVTTFEVECWEKYFIERRRLEEEAIKKK